MEGLFIHLSIYLSTYIPYLSTYLPTYLSCLSIYLSTYPPIYLSFYVADGLSSHTHTHFRDVNIRVYIYYIQYIYIIYMYYVYIYTYIMCIYIYQQNRASKNTMQFIRQIMRGKETREEKTSSFEVGALQFMLRFPTNLVRPRLQPVLLWRAVRP